MECETDKDNSGRISRRMNITALGELRNGRKKGTQGMALVKLKPGHENLRGAIGNLVLKHYGNKVVLTRKPVFRNRVFSEAQKARQEKFRDAAFYANQLMADPRAREYYEKESRSKRKPARSLIIADFLPRIVRDINYFCTGERG